MKKPSGTAPKRDSGKRPQLRVIRVLTEGTVTEPQYLNLIARGRRHDVTIQHHRDSAGSAPLTLVRAAREQQRESKRRPKANGPAFDEIWCVFDTDAHPDLHQALAEAASAGIHIALSNPCFELWLVLHAHDQNAHVAPHDIQRQARSLGLIDGKTIGGAHGEKLLLANVADAVDRAKRLDERHKLNGSPPGENPSSGMWRLISSIG